ncbi:MAG: lysophospholipid acyltransferase family protein [Bacteroidales bacterium]|nr:lysophospholipid acyltransferase family protein [Bacteroidales bacterium]
MKDIQPLDLLDIHDFNKRSDNFLNFLNKFIKFKKVKEIYKEHSVKEGIDFVDSILDELNLTIDISEKDLQRIPEKGAFIIVSNFPMGGLEALFLVKIISAKRPDFKIVTSHKYHEIEPFRNLTIPINKKDPKSFNPCLNCTKSILNYIIDGGSVGFFPAGRIATYNRNAKKILDVQWDIRIAKLIKIAKIPVVPIYFNDSFRKLFHAIGNLHPFLQSFFLQKEMLKKRNSIGAVRIGNPIKLEEQNNFPDLWQYSRFLRARVYALGANAPIDVDNFFKHKKKFRLSKVEKIAESQPEKVIIDQINKAKVEYLLYTQGGFDIICAPTDVFPNVLTELGRLREITFREVGEGTNKSIDIDEYDLYFQHLVIWDNKENKIVGAYRIGKGDEIVEQYSVDGFYISSLFRIKKGLAPVLKQSLEMGRSFIVREYQRKPLSLFMLWKGIFYFLLKNPQYRYLLGPVSISQDFSELTKNLIVNFFENYYFQPLWAKHIKPRKKYKVQVEEFDKTILLQDIGNDLNKLDRYVKEIEPDGRIPVLFKKYISLGAKTLAFNVDPKFNNCIDGLMLLDMFDVPHETLRVLAKDLEDESILERFNIEIFK